VANAPSYLSAQTGWTPPVPPGYTLKRKKPMYKRVWFWLLVVVVVIIVAIIASVASAVKKATSAPHTVIYKVTSDGRTAESVTYLNINGDGTSGEEQANGAKLPWAKTVKGKGDFSSYTLTAQAGDGAKKISCQITVDGKVKAQQISTGQFAVVSCSADAS
jgi:hypothetical protein